MREHQAIAVAIRGHVKKTAHGRLGGKVCNFPDRSEWAHGFIVGPQKRQSKGKLTIGNELLWLEAHQTS